MCVPTWVQMAGKRYRQERRSRWDFGRHCKHCIARTKMIPIASKVSQIQCVITRMDYCRYVDSRQGTTYRLSRYNNKRFLAWISRMNFIRTIVLLSSSPTQEFPTETISCIGGYLRSQGRWNEIGTEVKAAYFLGIKHPSSKSRSVLWQLGTVVQTRRRRHLPGRLQDWVSQRERCAAKWDDTSKSWMSQ